MEQLFLQNSGRELTLKLTNNSKLPLIPNTRLYLKGLISRVIFVDVPVSEAQRRLLNNRIIQQRYDVRDDNFAYAVAYFEPPTKDEGVIYFDHSEPLEEWILQNFKTTNL